jgi:hypothetical protein
MGYCPRFDGLRKPSFIQPGTGGGFTGLYVATGCGNYNALQTNFWGENDFSNGSKKVMFWRVARLAQW